MNILIVLKGLPDKKNPARSVFNLAFAKELVRQHHKVSILYLRAIKPNCPFLVTREVEGMKCFEVRSATPKIGFIKNSLFSSGLFNRILKNKGLNKSLNKVDIIHAIGGGTVEASYLLSKKYSIPMISQFIGSDLNVHFPRLLKNKNFLKGIDQSRFLCFNSIGLKEVFLSKFPEKENTKVLYRGVKLKDFPYWFTKSDRINLLFLGGFPSNKNLKGGLSLLKAIELLNEEKLPTKIKISIGGPNSLDYKESAKEIQNPNLELNFIGAVPKAVVKEKMKESHLVLIPSVAEGLPNVLYEAMASGNMIIASNVGGIPEILESGKIGELVPPNDAPLLMTRIVKSIRDWEHIERCAVQGRKKIEQMDYNKFIEGYLQVYKDSL